MLSFVSLIGQNRNPEPLDCTLEVGDLTSSETQPEKMTSGALYSDLISFTSFKIEHAVGDVSLNFEPKIIKDEKNCPKFNIYRDKEEGEYFNFATSGAFPAKFISSKDISKNIPTEDKGGEIDGAKLSFNPNKDMKNSEFTDEKDGYTRQPYLVLYTVSSKNLKDSEFWVHHKQVSGGKSKDLGLSYRYISSN